MVRAERTLAVSGARARLTIEADPHNQHGYPVRVTKAQTRRPDEAKFTRARHLEIDAYIEQLQLAPDEERALREEVNDGRQD